MYRLDDGRLRNAKKLRDQSVVRARKKCTIGVTRPGVGRNVVIAVVLAGY